MLRGFCLAREVEAMGTKLKIAITTMAVPAAVQAIGLFVDVPPEKIAAFTSFCQAYLVPTLATVLSVAMAHDVGHRWAEAKERAAAKGPVGE